MKRGEQAGRENLFRLEQTTGLFRRATRPPVGVACRLIGNFILVLLLTYLPASAAPVEVASRWRAR